MSDAFAAPAPSAGGLRAHLDAQRAALASVRASLATATATRDAAAADLRSLEYVSGLPRDAAARRRSGNARAMAAAGGGDPSAAAGDGGDGGLQSAEAELLAAKAELAALRLSVDTLSAKAAAPRPPRLRRAAGAGEGANATPRAAPRTPPASFARLIADVDVVVVVARAGGAARAAPARLGVTPAGRVALFGYHSAEPVQRFSGALRVSSAVPLADADERLLRRFLDTAEVEVGDPAEMLVQVGGGRARLCGLREALGAAAAVVNATSAAPRVFDGAPASPRGGRTVL